MIRKTDDPRYRLKGAITMSKKNYWDMTKEEKEAMLAEAAREEIAKHHAAGRSTIHGDNIGVFLMHPDGRKQYVKTICRCPRSTRESRAGQSPIALRRCPGSADSRLADQSSILMA
jgi:hypothetical protein